MLTCRAGKAVTQFYPFLKVKRSRPEPGYALGWNTRIAPQKSSNPADQVGHEAAVAPAAKSAAPTIASIVGAGAFTGNPAGASGSASVGSGRAPAIRSRASRTRKSAPRHSGT